MQSNPRPQLRRRIRFFLHRWHRRLGLLVSFLLILLVITGVALNHTGHLELDNHYPQSRVLLWPYQSVLPDNIGYRGRYGLLYSANGMLMLEEEVIADCDRLTGAAETLDYVLVSCLSGWHLLTGDYQLIESFDPAFLSLADDARPAISEGQLVAGSPDHWQRLDVDALTLEDVMPHARTPSYEVLPSVNQSISWQRVMQDIHSGRWFGRWGIWVIDAAAFGMLLLVFSGIWMWWSRPGNRR